MIQLETMLGLDQITPMQTSYTQTAEDRKVNGVEGNDKSSSKSKESGIEPSDDKK